MQALSKLQSNTVQSGESQSKVDANQAFKQVETVLIHAETKAKKRNNIDERHLTFGQDDAISALKNIKSEFDDNHVNKDQKDKYTRNFGTIGSIYASGYQLVPTHENIGNYYISADTGATRNSKCSA